MFFEHRLRKKQVLFYQGDPASTLCIVKTGSLVKAFVSETRSLVLAHHGSGDVIGEAEVLYSHRQRFVTTTALTETAVWQCERPSLERILAAYPIIYQRLFDVIGDRFIQAGRKITYLALMDARMRIFQLLIDYVSDHLLYAPGRPIPIWKVTQQEMAELVGLNRESVARALSELQALHAIRVSRGILQITDFPMLKSLAQTLPAGTFQPEPSQCQHYSNISSLL